MPQPAILVTIDRADFALAWDLQHALVQERAADRRPETLILLEHSPVLTIGRSGREEHWRCNPETLQNHRVPIYHIERGGSVTYHGPGQVVGYPILHLRSFCPGPKVYMRMLEEVVIRTLGEWGIHGRRIEKFTGVWVGERHVQKIAAMGVRITHGVTMHGFALNVAIDLQPFQYIQPCGIPDCQVTSMAQLLGEPVDPQKVRTHIAQHFAEVFGLTWIARKHDDQLTSHGESSPARQDQHHIRPDEPVSAGPLLETRVGGGIP